MSFKHNAIQQTGLLDNFNRLSERAQKAITESWPGKFAEIVFPAINEERFAVLYSDNRFSRPNTPVNIIIGALILKEHMQLSDDEVVNSLDCDVRFQYALHTSHLDTQPLSDRSLSRFRERVYKYDLAHNTDLLGEEMKSITKVFMDYIALVPNLKRMDSLMVASNCKSMSRLEIIYKTIQNMVTLLNDNHRKDLIPAELAHYLEKDDLNKVIYYAKSEETDSRLEKVVAELESLNRKLDTNEWKTYSQYILLQRVINEQTTLTDQDKLRPKTNDEIKTDSMQNPSDPDATYRLKAGKSHKGYVANVVEAIGKDGDSLIVDLNYNKNVHSDSEFTKEYIESRPDNAEPEILITDGAYGGEENAKLAEEKNVKLIVTALVGKQVDKHLADFEMDEKGETVTKCPMGHAPQKCTYYPKTESCRALFAVNTCGQCPHKDKCHAKKQKENYVVRISKKMIERANYSKQLGTEEMKKFTKQRNAIEGIPSVLRRKFHIDHIPVRGFLKSRFWVQLKVMAYNLQKLLLSFTRQRESFPQVHRDNYAQNVVFV